MLRILLYARQLLSATRAPRLIKFSLQAINAPSQLPHILISSTLNSRNKLCPQRLLFVSLETFLETIQNFGI